MPDDPILDYQVHVDRWRDYYRGACVLLQSMIEATLVEKERVLGLQAQLDLLAETLDSEVYRIERRHEKQDD